MLVGWSSDADLEKVPHGIHGFCEPPLRSAFCPEERLRVGLREHARGADEVPSGQRKTRVTVVLLGGNVLRRRGSAGGDGYELVTCRS